MTLDVTGLDLSGRCAIHGERGCFDCMVGGTNPTPKMQTPKRGNYGDQFRKPDLSSAVGGYAEVKRLAEQAARNADAEAEARSEREAEGAWLRHAEREDPEAQEDLRRFDEEFPHGYGNDAPAVDPNLASDKQRNFVTQLLSERGTPQQRGAVDVESLLRWEASKLIDDLLKQPRTITGGPRVIAPSMPTPAPRPVAPAPLPQVPDGHYAIEIDGTVKFYRVNTGRDGRVWLDIQASDDLHPIHNYATKLAVLTAIAADVRGALTRYGHALGVCGVCNRTLTDAESIAAGIGPVCAAKGGI